MREKEPMRALEQFLERARLQVNVQDMPLVEAAYDLAAEAHNGQKRMSGEPYLTHPVAVADIIMSELRIRDGGYCAVALLHDVLEDGRGFYERRIAHEVGADILAGVRVLTKDRRHKRAYMAQVRAGDVRERIVKLADKIHNLRTIRYMPPANARAVVANALRDYVPLAKELLDHLVLGEQWRAKWLHDEIVRLCRESANL